MKRLFVCVLIFILALCVAAPVSAESDSAFYAFVRVTKAKVYSGADMTTGIGTLEKFEIVRVEDYTSETCMVTKSGKTGYMYIKDLSRVDSIDKSASITARVKVYTKPSTSAKGSYVAKGTGVTVIAVNGSWAMIEKNGNTGYIKTSYLKYVNIAQVVTPKPTATPTVKPENTPVVCDFSARVSVSSVTVYAAASTSSTKLGTMKNGTVVTVKAYNPTWAYIELNGRTGYCAKSALTKIASTVTPTVTPKPTPSPTTVPEADPMRECAPFSVIASVEKAKVYSEPALTSKYLGYISGSTEVSVLAYNSVWAKIELNGKIGYALKIELVKPGSVTPTPTMVPSPTPTPTPTPSPTPAPTPTATPVPTATATAQVYPESTDPIFTDKTTTNQEKAFLFLSLDTDYNEAVACGLIANMMSESSCNPKSKNSAGYRGICQWSTSRFSILESWCIENKLDPDSLEGQLKFLRYDLSKRYTVYHKYLLTVENTAQGAYDAGYYFCLKYERPGNTEAASVKRGTNAKDIYWPKFVENK